MFTGVISPALFGMEGFGHAPSISFIADAAAGPDFADLDIAALKFSLMGHAAGGLVVLIWAATLAVYKPRGLTRYGWQRRQAEAD